MPEGLRFSVSFNEELKFISEGLCVGDFREGGNWLDSGRFAISTLLSGTPGVLAETGSSYGFVKFCDGCQDLELMLSDCLKICYWVMQVEVLFPFMKHEN